MSKRNRKKYKRIVTNQSERKIETNDLAENSQINSVKEKEELTDPIEIEDAKLVKNEIRKILLTILILILIVVAIYFINVKSNIILKVGEFIANKLNLSI